MARPKRDEKAEKARQEAKQARIEAAKEEKEKLKAKAEAEEKANQLSDSERINRLEFVIAKMAHFLGVPKIIREAGLKTWEPSQKDMTKFKNEIKPQ